MLDASQCRMLANEYKSRARETGISKDLACIMNNIARSLMGLATQLDICLQLNSERKKGGDTYLLNERCYSVLG
jgi:hypothetical protein